MAESQGFTVGKWNYFMGYGILLHELPVVVVLLIQSNNNEGTMKYSILHEIFSGHCRFLNITDYFGLLRIY